MAGKLSPGAQTRLAALQQLGDRVHRVYALVEQYAAARTNADQLLMPLGRQLGQLKMAFMGAGMDGLSQLSGAMEIAARRGTTSSAKIRVLREGVGSLKFQIELEQRAVVSEDQAAQQKAAARKEE